MDRRERRAVLRMIPHGIQVVTVRDGEESHGYTSSWLTQASFEPPLLALAVRADSHSCSLLARGGVCCVHFLGKEQQEIAERFFRPAGRAGDKFAGLSCREGEATGCVVIEDALAHAECRVVHRYAGGDHVVFVAEVLDARVHREGAPLVLADTPWQYGG